MAYYQLPNGQIVPDTQVTQSPETGQWYVLSNPTSAEGGWVALESPPVATESATPPERSIAEQLGFSKADLARYEAAGLYADEVGRRLQSYLQQYGQSPYDVGFWGQSARDRVMGFQVDPRQEAAEQYALNEAIMRTRAGEPTIAGLPASLVQGVQMFASLVGAAGGLPGLPIPSTGNAIVDAAIQGGGRGAISSALSGQDIGAGALKGAAIGAIGGGVSQASQAAGIPTDVAKYTNPALTASLTGGNPLAAVLQQGIRGAMAAPGMQYRTSTEGYGSPDYAYSARLEGGPELEGFDQPLYDPTTGEQLTPEQVAERFPELYPGGTLPKEGQETVYGRFEGGLKVPSGLLAKIFGSGTRSPTSAASVNANDPQGSIGIPWLCSRADILRGSESNYQPLEISALPGIGNQIGMAHGGKVSGLLNVPRYTSGSDVSSDDSSSFSTITTGLNEMDKTLKTMTPNFLACTQDVLTSKAPKRDSLTLAKLKHMAQSISPQGHMGGLAEGGLPKKYEKATPQGHNPEFITGLTGYYADGRGTGQSDDIPALLHDGDYVMDAETVSALGDGSSKAGREVLDGFRNKVPHGKATGGQVVPAKIADGEYVFPAAFVTALGGGDNKRGAEILDGLREKLRAHKRSAPLSKIPPKAKSPLEYIKKAKG
jgi:hypothetical protein